MAGSIPAPGSIQPYLGTKRLTDLTPLDVKRWHGTLLDGGRHDGDPLAVASVKLAHRILHRALADAVRWNLIAVNPAWGVRVRRSAAPEMTVWTSDETRRFLDAVADDRLVALWTLALHSGLRRGELAGLRWVDVDRPRCRARRGGVGRWRVGCRIGSDGVPGRRFLLDMDFLLYEVSAQRGDAHSQLQCECNVG